MECQNSQELLKQAPRWVQLKGYLKKQTRADQFPLARLLLPIIQLPTQQGDIMEQWGDDPASDGEQESKGDPGGGKLTASYPPEQEGQHTTLGADPPKSNSHRQYLH